MTAMGVLLVAVIFVAIGLVARAYGAISVMMLGVAGLLAQSAPAIVGVYMPPTESDRILVPTSEAATLQLVIAWLSIIAFVVLAASGRRVRQARLDLALDEREVRCALWVLFVVGTALYGVIALHDGPLYFLNPRSVESVYFEEGRLIWRWCSAIGLLTAILVKKWTWVVVFGTYVLIYFIAGDRTAITIVMAAAAIVMFSGKRLSYVLGRPYIPLLAVAAVSLSVLGKPIYLSVKEGSLSPFVDNFVHLDPLLQLSYFEPFLTHNHLEVVVASGYHFPWTEVLLGVAGQILVVPSAFGIDSSSFNVEFTREFYPWATYGLANNYWSQGFAAGGTIGVVIFAVIYAATLAFVQRMSGRVGGVLRIFFVLSGALIAIYIHRNSIENIAAILRQIVLLGVLVIVATTVLYGPRRLGGPQISTRSP